MSIPLQEPDIDRAGRVDLESLRQMHVEPLAGWIARVLLHDDARVVGQRDDEAYLYLGRLYRNLAGATRECFQDAVLRLLAKLAADPYSAPETHSADGLLLLVSEIFRDSEPQRRSDPVSHLLIMANEEPERRSREIHTLVLLTLVDLSYPADVDFWESQFQRDKDHYAGITFAGLTLLGLREAFNWLILNIDRPNALDALLSRLPLLLEEKPKGHIEEWIQRLCHHLPQEELTHLLSYAKDFLKLSIDPSPFVNLADGELADLIWGLGLDSILEFDSRQEKLSALDSLLRESLPPELKTSKAVPKSALTLLAACQRLASPRASEIADELKNKIVERARTLAEVLPENEIATEALLWAISTAEDYSVGLKDFGEHIEHRIAARAY